MDWNDCISTHVHIAPNRLYWVENNKVVAIAEEKISIAELHMRLGHINLHGIWDMLENEALCEVKINEMDDNIVECKSCNLGIKVGFFGIARDLI